MFLEEEKKESSIEILIPACDGTVSLQKSRKMFEGEIFLSNKGFYQRETPEQLFVIRTFFKTMKFESAINLIIQEQPNPFATEHQGVHFCKEFEQLLQPLGKQMFFLLDDDYYVKFQKLRTGIGCIKHPLSNMLSFESSGVTIIYPKKI